MKRVRADMLGLEGEKGFTKMPNDLLAAIFHSDITKRQLLVILAVLRNTLGWQRTRALCSISWLKQPASIGVAVRKQELN